MSSLPLHPAIVHLPLGLAFVIPFIAIGLAWALWRGRVTGRAWLGIVALQAVLLGGGLLAMNTGEREEHRVEGIVPDPALERHEAYAEQFVWAVGGTLGLSLLAFAFRRTALVHALTLTTIAGTLIVAGAAVRVGRAGGELVYVHNAAAAYAGGAQGADAAKQSPEVPGRAPKRAGDDDDDH